VARMYPARHREVARHAGGLLRGPLPNGVYVDEVEEIEATAGVYIVCTRDDEVLYTGSARRPSDPHGLVRRMREHLRKEHRRMRWHRVWLVPMKTEATLDQVRLVEGMIGRDLGAPESRKLPRIVRVRGRSSKGVR
jgi:hypothetical protein